jgi:hypothetical protein
MSGKLGLRLCPALAASALGRVLCDPHRDFWQIEHLATFHTDEIGVI